jgi:flagellar L-ring protein precursor FlgH
MKKLSSSSTLALCASAWLLSGCVSTLDKLETVGDQPPLTKTEDPTTRPDYKPVSWPVTKQPLPSDRQANSLWQPGARAFFRDQRASRVGDILRVRIAIKDKAELNNETQRKRDTKENVGAPSVFGLEKRLGILTPGSPNPDSLFDISGKTDNKGTGTVKRQEKIETQVAALITQVLPNGNYVISGSQEMRINYEVREVSVSGVVRPEDIDMDNTVDSSQIAEARVIYGGRGQLTDVQQPRWGSQVIDILSPF